MPNVNPGPASSATTNLLATLAAASVAQQAPETPIVVVGQTSVPAGIAPTGTVAANAAVTLGTALLLNYGSLPGIWLYFPAGALYAGSAAGVYYCQMSSTTLGQAYNLNLVPGQLPYVPTAAQLAATVITAPGPGAYTQTTATLLELFRLQIPAGIMGPSGSLDIEADVDWTNNGNTKTLNMVWGGQTLLSSNATTNASLVVQRKLSNRGGLAVQLTQPAGNIGFGVSGSGNTVQLVQDTSQAINLIVQGNLVTAGTDFIVWESIRVTARYGA